MGLFDLFKKKSDETKVGNVEDFISLTRVYFQSVIATNLGITNIRFLPDVANFKRLFKVPTQNGKLGLAEKSASRKMLMQDYGLIEDYTVYENICIPLEINNNKESAKWKIDNVLNQIGIDELSNKNVMQLSGGQRQRVAIARAIVNSPSVILADEPTGALDTNTSEDIINIFKNINKQGVTVFIVTHEPTVAEQCGRIISICDGTIAAIKTNSNLQ